MHMKNVIRNRIFFETENLLFLIISGVTLWDKDRFNDYAVQADEAHLVGK